MVDNNVMCSQKKMLHTYMYTNITLILYFEYVTVWSNGTVWLLYEM